MIGPTLSAATCFGCFLKSATIPALNRSTPCLRAGNCSTTARCASSALPGQASLDALKAALDSVPKGYRNNIAHALRMRGVEPGLEKYPQENMIPPKQVDAKSAGKGTP